MRAPIPEEQKPESVVMVKGLAKRYTVVGRIRAATLAFSLSLGLATAFAGSPVPPQSVTAVEEIGTVRQMYDGALYPDIQVRTFRHIDRLFPTRTVKRGTHVYPLLKSDTPLRSVEFTAVGKKYDMYDYMSVNRVSGLLVLKNGKIAFERYELGNTENTLDVHVGVQVNEFDSCWSRDQGRLHQEYR
jgi:hypothetical protein